MKRFLPLLVATGLILSACGKSETTTTPATSGNGTSEKKLVVAMLPKSKGNAYFESCAAGAKKAADELGVEFRFDGPTDSDAAKQSDIVDNWITQDVDVIAASAASPSISAALKKAQDKGIKVITFDADAAPDSRSFFVNQATPKGIGYTLMDEAARICGKSGEFAIITAHLDDPNQNEWKKFIDEDNKNYPDMKLVAGGFVPCDDNKDKAQAAASALMSANPNLKLIMVIGSPGVPGAAEAVKQAGKAGKVHVIGLGLPSENKDYVHAGVTDSVILWDTGQLGYLTVQAAVAVAKGTLKKGDKEFKVGDTTYVIDGDSILLGKPTIFNKDNIDKFNF